MKSDAGASRRPLLRLTARQALILAGIGMLNLVLAGGAGLLYWREGLLSPASPELAPPTQVASALISDAPTLPTPNSPSVQQDPTATPISAATPLAVSNLPLPSRTPTSPPAPSATPASTARTLIGHSVAGRELVVERFGDGPLERMIVAGIHGGNEYNTVLLAEALIAHLQANPQALPPGVTLFILPNLNPDGYARSWDIYGRANENGVDLNHNFPIAWQADWSRDGCWRYLHLTGGKRPASEPETMALMNFLLTRRVDALISYHSAALGIFPGGDPPDPDSATLAQAIAEVSDYPYPPIDSGCEMTGSLADWAVSRGIAAVDVELSDHRHTDFAQNLRILSRLLTWVKP